MKTMLEYLEKQIISNYDMVDDDTIPDQLTGVTYQQMKEGEIPF